MNQKTTGNQIMLEKRHQKNKCVLMFDQTVIYVNSF